MDLLSEIGTLKSRAMTLRDGEEYEDALETLEDAEQRIRAELGEIANSPEGPGRYERSLRAQLYGILGSKGGVYRRWKRLSKSISAYDAGYEIEKSFEDSYNLTQRLVTRVMFDPQSVAGTGGIVAGVAVRDALRKAEETIRTQMESTRHDNEYAAADLLTVLLLLGDPGWRDALQQFLHRAAKSSYARDATKLVFEEIAEQLRATGFADTPLTRDLAEVLSRF
jgi:tetratricopeptide (TPR) repeat protein